jgi:predicted outer membrane repeat protein/parallel beta-helix repeat protein
MQLFSWLKRTTGQSHTGRTPTARFRPQLESLDDRLVPSTLTVTNAADSGAGSLRADIAAAKSGDTIVFAPSLVGQTITLTSGELSITTGVTIQGPAADQLTVSGNNQSRVFEVNASQPVVLSGMTITQGNGAGGRPWGGGAVLDYASTLAVNNCTLSNNVAAQGGAIANIGGALTMSGCTVSNNSANGVYGGGIYTQSGVLQIANSTLTGNHVSGPDYGMGEGGAVYSLLSKVSLTNCTLSNNSAVGTGGAIYESGGTYMTISGCTFSGNVIGVGTTSIGNDIYNATTASQLTISNSVFTNNTGYTFEPIIGPWTTPTSGSGGKHSGR